MASTSFAGLLAVSALTLAGVAGAVPQNLAQSERSTTPLGGGATLSAGNAAKNS
ncbi:hypothetical protein CFAEC_13135 [Corynebacterium faecale]|uniref:hypothetical protein n=1 Tax=Corynebacterium faecale TaxID=1758466 RepID=UPI0025B56306|nr:hypothetical protein [Corynebacterium faecale]WJY93412.1 hypothetical protein CFAEC_13135 [Corynebacterium faecale]